MSGEEIRAMIGVIGVAIWLFGFGIGVIGVALFDWDDRRWFDPMFAIWIFVYPSIGAAVYMVIVFTWWMLEQ